jgi:hypothetical protein
MQSKAANDVTQKISAGFELATDHAIDNKSLKALEKLILQSLQQIWKMTKLKPVR